MTTSGFQFVGDFLATQNEATFQGCATNRSIAAPGDIRLGFRGKGEIFR